MNISCNGDIPVPDGYTKYQTFNEYTLKGVSANNDKIKSPYVFVKEEADTISIIVSSQKENVIKYINKGDYWYNLRIEKIDYQPDCKCDTTPLYYEKFIYNDTILLYNCRIKDGIQYSHSLILETENNYTYISPPDNMEIKGEFIFANLKKLAKNYKNLIPYYSRGPEHQPCFYESFTKVFKENKLYLYENKGTDELVCLKDVRQLNSLGEFDRLKGTSIIDRIQDDNKCK